jgi:hypothetical protein
LLFYAFTSKSFRTKGVNVVGFTIIGAMVYIFTLGCLIPLQMSVILEVHQQAKVLEYSIKRYFLRKKCEKGCCQLDENL